jgi:hypothetical protein
MTNTQQLGVSVLSAPLGAIDRRSLSQAWYSALHLAHERPSASPALSRVAAQPSREARTVTTHAARPGNLVAFPATQRGAGNSATHTGVSVERRSPRSPLARRIERAVLDRRVPAPNAAFTVRAGALRAVVVVSGAAGRLRLVALCSPSSRRAVARALEEARFALASRGILLETGLLGARSCS